MRGAAGPKPTGFSEGGRDASSKEEDRKEGFCFQGEEEGPGKEEDRSEEEEVVSNQNVEHASFQAIH
jgi:hypothetical protein